MAAVARDRRRWAVRIWYQPDGWGKAYRFLALRYEKKRKAGEVSRAPDQYQLFETLYYIYRGLELSRWSTGGIVGVFEIANVGDRVTFYFASRRAGARFKI